MISFDPGLIIWTTIIFTLLLIVLRKFAWKPILNSVDERNKKIQEALEAADKAKEEMKLLNADNERIISEAKLERDTLLKEAREIKQKIITEAKDSSLNNVGNKLNAEIIEHKNFIGGRFSVLSTTDKSFVSSHFFQMNQYK